MAKRKTSPHDHLVRHTLAIPENAAVVLQSVLPPKLLSRLDLTTLRREPGTFVDASDEARTDLLFSVRLDGRQVLLYLLIEHQSRPDPSMPLRMYVYFGRVWSALWGDGRREPLPIIVPVVLHHGPEGWTAPRSLGAMLDWADWDPGARALVARWVPDFELLIDDLARVPETALLARAGAPLGRVVVWVLRATRVGFDPTLLSRWARELDAAEASGAREAFLHVVQYLVGTDEGSALVEALEATLSGRVREVVMGLQKRWLDQGREEGREEGRKKGRAEILLKQLRLRFGRVPRATERRVRAASDAELERWAERVLSDGSLDDVLG